MDTLFRPVEQVNPSNSSAPKMYYARIVKSKEANIRDLVADISHSSSVNASDVMAVLESFIELLPRYLGSGYRVKLGDFGSFRLTASSNGENTAEEVTSRSIRALNIRFSPGAVLKNRLKQIRLRKAE